MCARRRPKARIPWLLASVAFVQPGQVGRALPGFAGLHKGHLVHLKRDVTLFTWSLWPAWRLLMGKQRIPAAEVKAGTAVLQRHPLHRQRAGVGVGYLVRRLADPSHALEIIAYVFDALSQILGVEQVGLALRQGIDGAQAGIDPLVEGGFGAVGHPGFKYKPVLFQADREAQGDAALAVPGALTCRRRSAPNGKLTDTFKLLPVGKNDILPVITCFQDGAEQTRWVLR